MYYNVYRTSNNGNDLWLKKQHSGDVVEHLTGKALADSLPNIMSDEVALLFNTMRFMKQGETLQYKEFLIECI